MDFIKYLLENWSSLLSSVSSVCVALIALFMLIPGEQPEKALQSIVDFIGKFSRK